MISLFPRYRVSPLNVVTLPSYCVSVVPSETLVAKREARLEWMRDNGLAYLGDPRLPLEKAPPRKLTVTPVRLVSVRKDAPPAAEFAQQA